MRIISSLAIENGEVTLDRDTQLWVYNGLDCTITREIFPHLRKEMDRKPGAQKAYDFERAMLGPALTMMRRGLRVDESVVDRLVTPLKSEGFKLRVLLNYLSLSKWGKRLNPASPAQLQKFFYEFLAIPPQKKMEKGVWKVTTNSEAMEKIRDGFPRGSIFASIILSLRDVEKKLNVLLADRDRDGRMKTSFNVAGTETWRWSSSTSPFWNGINVQNVTKDLREMFIPDEGKRMFYADLEQAESRTVAYLSGDEKYIAACEGGDLHTTVCRMTWPQFDWDGSSDEGLPYTLEQDEAGWWQLERKTGKRYNKDPFARRDRAIAEMPFLSIYSFRDMCKRSGHGTNYGLQPHSLARHLKIELKHAIRFQLMYYGGCIEEDNLYRWHKQSPESGFDRLIEGGNRLKNGLIEIEGAFPGIRKWHDEVAKELQLNMRLTTPFGFTREFWGRTNEATTLREAIAFLPQSTIGCLLNVGLWRLWHECEPELQMLGQVHDAVLGQAPEEEIDRWSAIILDKMVNPLYVNGRKMIIPSTIEWGPNWKDMKKWKPSI